MVKCTGQQRRLERGGGRVGRVWKGKPLLLFVRQEWANRGQWKEPHTAHTHSDPWSNGPPRPHSLPGTAPALPPEDRKHSHSPSQRFVKTPLDRPQHHWNMPSERRGANSINGFARKARISIGRNTTLISTTFYTHTHPRLSHSWDPG